VRILTEQLDSEQESIALDSARNLLVLAGPGSGKTHLLTNVAAYHVRRTPESRSRVLCVTFTVEATNQLRHRLRDPRLGIRASNRIHVSNFHQLGAQILHAYADQVGWVRTSQMLGEPQELLREILNELSLGYVRVQGLETALGRLRNRRPGIQGPVPPETLSRIADAYEARKVERGVWDFDDLIIRAVELLDRAPRVLQVLQTIFGFVVVDELQDTSGHQLELLARISGEGRTPIFGVADDDQMIYSWRDARPENISEFLERFNAEERYLLGNYRCPPRIVEAANLVIAPTREPGDERVAVSRVVGRRGQLLVAGSPYGADHALLVGQVVRRELDEGVPPEQIAILSAVAFKFKELKPALDAMRIPYVHVGDRSLATTLFARVLLATLSCQQGTPDERARARLLRILAAALPLAEESEILATAERLVATPTSDSALALSQEVLSITQDDRDVAHIRRIIRAATMEASAYSRQHTATSILVEWSRLDAKLRREERSVKLMTTFGAKGLEFNTVVMPYFDEELAPYSPKGQPIDW
jgi:DNA helicase-2/ATP-dependent DNA helicase PcrA